MFTDIINNKTESTYAWTHNNTHSHMYTCIQIIPYMRHAKNAVTCTCTHTGTCMYMYMYTHTHIQLYTHTCTCTHSQTYSHQEPMKNKREGTYNSHAIN